MQELGAEKVFVDKASGKNVNRPQLNEMLAFARQGDTIVVESISRFARNTKDLLELMEKMSLNPARLYKLDCGRICEGAPADLVIFDENETWTADQFASKASNTPFLGRTMTGKVKYTICEGKVVYQD